MTLIRRMALAWASAAAIAMAASATIRRQDLVLIDVVVENEKGTLAEGLTTNDIEVRSDGMRRPIELFRVSTPVSILAVIDRSMSVSSWDLDVDKTLSDTIYWLSDQARPAYPIRVGGLTRRLRLMPSFAVDRATLLAGARPVVTVPASELVGPTPIVDAIDNAVRELSETPGRRALVLLTDGRSGGNQLSAAEVQRQVVVAGVTVNVVLISSSNSSVAAALHPAVLLRPIVDASGGALLLVKQPVSPEPERSLERIFTRLRRTYTVGIASAGDGRFHELAIKVNRKGVRVSARAGYQSR